MGIGGRSRSQVEKSNQGDRFEADGEPQSGAGSTEERQKQEDRATMRPCQRQCAGLCEGRWVSSGPTVVVAAPAGPSTTHFAAQILKREISYIG